MFRNSVATNLSVFILSINMNKSSFEPRPKDAMRVENGFLFYNSEILFDVSLNLVQYVE